MSAFTQEQLESMKNVERTRAARLNAVLERFSAEEKEQLLKDFHPDYSEKGFKVLEVGPNKGEKVPVELAALLEGKSIVADAKIDLEKIDYDVDVLIIGAGGAGAAAAIEAKKASLEMALLSSELKNAVLFAIAENLEKNSARIFDANKKLVVFYNPAGLKDFDTSAQELVEEYSKYREITYGQNYNIPNKAIGFINDPNDKRVGYVVTGYSDEFVNNSTVDSIVFLGLTGIFGLIIGIMGAIYLAQRVKKILFGLEPEEIATLLQERNVILNSVREGVINVNAQGIVTLINMEAETLLTEANVPNISNMVNCLAKEVLPSVPWNSIIKDGKTFGNAAVKIGDTVFMLTAVPIYLQNEIEQSKYNFEVSDADRLFTMFDLYQKEVDNCIAAELVLPAYDYVLKCSHTFNLLDARGVISKDERNNFIRRVRTMASSVAKLYVEQREKLGFPLCK